MSRRMFNYEMQIFLFHVMLHLFIQLFEFSSAAGEDVSKDVNFLWQIPLMTFLDSMELPIDLL